MKLDMNCVRDIMLTIENQTTSFYMSPDDFCKLLPDYTQEEIIYCCEKLYEGNYLHLEVIALPGNRQPVIRAIGELTFDGHMFLADIKPKTTWQKLSPKLSKLGSASFSVIAEVAKQLGTDALLNL